MTLTTTQLEILRLRSLGFSIKQIAEKVHLSKPAVDANLQRMRKKYNCDNSQHLVTVAIKNNII